MISPGNLKSLRLLWANLAGNHRYSRFLSKKDIQSFLLRSENEGLTFLTTTLPTLGKALDTFHSTNVWKAPDQFKTDEDGIPIFLGHAIRLALDGNSLAVDCVRQLTLIFYKLEVDYDPETIGQFLDQFVITDRDLVVRTDSSEQVELIRDMRRLIARILCNTNPREIRPCHGSGATADHTKNWQKWHQLRYFKKLDDFFSYPDLFFFNFDHLVDEMEKLQSSEEGLPQARVCLVPKDSRGPRVISCEPTEFMYAQQGLMRLLYKTIETHDLTRGQINFIDQGVNRQLACDASKRDSHTTIDLKDASDRVTLDLVERVFPPIWVEAFKACRSEETLLPDGRIVKLNKFAPMGSACCFPVEALIFWACATAAIFRSHLSSESITSFRMPTPRYGPAHFSRQLSFPVYVYGDDIIIDSKFTESVVRGLSQIGLLVNLEKTYRSGPFRESCGGDFHFGMDVTPVRVRKIPSSVGTGLATSADLANEFIAKFGYEDSHSLIRVIEEAVGYSFPRTELDIPCSVRSTSSASNDVFFKRRWNKSLQRFEHLVLQLHSEVLTKQPPNWGELLRKELSREIASRLHGSYEHPVSFLNAKCDPGTYVATHATHKKWAWVWLG
jgi:hypothetical protein